MQKNILQTNLKLLRENLGLSLAKFSKKIDIPMATLVCYERGERTPSANLFMQLHSVLNVNLNWFVTGYGEMFSSNHVKSNLDFDNRVRKVLKEEGLIK